MPWTNVVSHALMAFSVAGIVAPFSYYAGLAARALKLPQITGYLVSGIICGPYVLGILSKDSMLDLNIIEGACLGIIGLAAGAELTLTELSRSKNQVLGITLGVCVVTWGVCYGALEWVGHYFPLMPNMDGPHLAAVATLGATLMMTRSPASAIAVIKEVDGKGPFCSLVMAVIVVKDVFVIVAFALNMELIRATILPSGATSAVGVAGAGGMSFLALVLPIISLLLSVAVGACGGLIMGIVMRPHSVLVPTLQGMSAAAHGRARMVGIVIVSTFIFQVAHYFDAEPLLACVTMGMVVVNRRHERADKEKEELHSLLAQIMALSNVAFFGLAGASIKLVALRDMFWGACIVCVLRLGGIFCGSWLGCTLTSSLPEHRRLFWMSQVTQAGVALGLARLAGTRFPDWGPHFQTFMVSIILVNLLVGPPLFRYALVRAGEARGVLKASNSFPELLLPVVSLPEAPSLSSRG